MSEAKEIGLPEIISDSKSEHSGIEDKLLVLKLKEGNLLAFEKLFNKYKGKVYGFIKQTLNNSTDAEELTQEVFVKLWSIVEQLDPEKSFSSLLFTVAKNKVKDHLKKLLNQKRYLQSISNPYARSDNSLEASMDYYDTVDVLNHLLHELPPKRRRVFELGKLHDKTYKEIAQEMGISENTVDTQMRKAMQYVRAGLQKMNALSVLLIF